MKKLIAIVLMLLPMLANAQHLVQFKWQEQGTADGYSPAVTIGVGEQHQLKFSTTPYTPNIFNDDYSFDWVYYELIENTWMVVNTPNIFSITEGGQITGLKAGFAAICPTGYIQGNNERLYIKVAAAEEKEPNDTNDAATTLNSGPIRFSISTHSDIDWFKVFANKGDEIVFRISPEGAINQSCIFQVETYDPQLTMWGKYNEMLSPGAPYFEVPLKAEFYTGEYYIKLSFNNSPMFYYSGALSIQAFINGEPAAGAFDAIVEPDDTIEFFNLQGQPVDIASSKGQIIIKVSGGKATKIVNN